MEIGVLDVALPAGSYALGMLPTAVWVGRRLGHDPTVEGSHNPGATNVYRTAGARAGLAVLAGDMAKGAVAAGAGWLAGDHLLGLACGAAAVAGHVLPVTRRFRGGKGVATSAGATIVLYPVVGVGAALVWAATAKVARRASVASLVAVATVPAGAAVAGAPAVEVGLLCAMAVVVVARHASNIVRLAHGDEPVVARGDR